MTVLDARHALAVTPPNAPPPGRRAWTAWLLVIVIVTAAVVGGRLLVAKRHQAATTMVLDSAVLGAQQIPVGPADAAIVASVQVAPGQLVHSGQTLAQLALAADSAQVGGGVLLAPADGVIVSVDRPAGSVVKAGEPVITEYSSASLMFIATLTVERAQKLRVGMSVAVDGPGLTTPIAATVGTAQPNLAGSTPNVIDVALIPRHPSDVRGLVPGLAFRATITLTTYPRDAASVLGAGP